MSEMGPNAERRSQDDFPLAFKCGRRRTSFPPPSQVDLPTLVTPKAATVAGAPAPKADATTAGGQPGCDTWQHAEAPEPSIGNSLPVDEASSQERVESTQPEDRPERTSAAAKRKTFSGGPATDCASDPSEDQGGAEGHLEPFPPNGVKRLRVGHALQLLDTNLPTLRPGSALSKANPSELPAASASEGPAEVSADVSGRRGKGRKGGVPKVPVKEEDGGESDSVAEEGGLAYCRKEKSLGLLCDK